MPEVRKTRCTPPCYKLAAGTGKQNTLVAHRKPNWRARCRKEERTKAPSKLVVRMKHHKTVPSTLAEHRLRRRNAAGCVKDGYIVGRDAADTAGLRKGESDTLQLRM